jgi:hypothetical protein
MTRLAAALIGRPVIDAGGVHLGRVIAVIHRAQGADVLVEQRGWLRRRRTYRFAIDDVMQRPDGLLAVDSLQRREASGAGGVRVVRDAIAGRQ